MILYKNTKKVFCLPVGNIDIINIIPGVMHGDTILPYNLPWLRISTVNRSDKGKWYHAKNARSRWYPTETMTDADYADDLALLANTLAQAESLLHCLDQATGGSGLSVNVNRTVPYILNKKELCQYIYIYIYISYGCTTWTLTKGIEKKLDRNYKRMLSAIFNESGKREPTKEQLYDHLPPISQTILLRWTRHARHCRRSKNKLVSDVLLRTPTNEQTQDTI